MTALFWFRELCRVVASRGMHTELHVGHAKGEKTREYRDPTLLRVVDTRGDEPRVLAQRATSWATLDSDAEKLIEELAR